MKDISKLSLLEIADRFGWSNGLSYTVDSTLVPNEKREEVQQLLEEYENLFDHIDPSLVASADEKHSFDMNEAKVIMKKLEKYIDKKRYLYQACVNHIIYVKKVESGEIPFREVDAETFELTKKIIDDEKEFLKNADLLMESDIKFLPNSDRVQIITSDDVLRNPENKKGLCSRAKRRFEEIDSAVPMSMLLFFLDPNSFIHVCRYPELGEKLKERAYQKFRAKYPETEDPHINTNEKVTYLRKKGAEVIEANADYFNIEKLVVFALHDWKKIITDTKTEEMKPANMDKELIQHWIESARVLFFYIPRNKQVYINQVTGENIDLEKMIPEMEAHLHRFVNGKYLDQEKIDALKAKMLSGEVSYKGISPEDYKDAMRFTHDELIMILSHNLQAADFFLENGFITEEELGRLKSSQNIVTLYLKKDDSPEDFERFQTNLRIYKGLTLEGKTDEEKNGLGIDLLDIEMQLQEEEKVEDLYNFGLITCDNYVELIGNAALKELIEQGKIKPSDLQRLIGNNAFPLDEFKKVLIESQISTEEKIILIYNAFPNNEDREKRDELLKFLYKQVTSNKQQTGTGSGEARPIPDKIKEKKMVYDPCARWRLLSKLDPEYAVKYYSDGHVVFWEPNNGEYIIEKLFDPVSKSGEPRYAHGAATYILSAKAFNANKESIIVDGRIDRHFLSENRSEDGICRYIHKGWADSICRHYDIDNPSKYTKEQIREIREAAEEVENSKVERI